MKLLLVEDDIDISTMLKDYLASENFDVIQAFDGEEACNEFNKYSFDLVLLDLMIPRINGMDVMQEIRRNSTVPIIIMSAKDSDVDITLGLGLGADDYITKPFSVTQVLARIKANIRRTTKYSEPTPEKIEIINHCGLTLNLNNYTVMKNEITIELTAKEFEILKLLMEHPKRVYTKEQLYASVWNDAYIGDENAVNVHISRLRTKVEEDPRNPKIIVTVWGIGYKLGENNE